MFGDILGFLARWIPEYIDLNRNYPFGWATGFEIAQGGQATLRFHTSPLRYGMLAFQAIGWLAVVRVVVRRRRSPEGATRVPQERPA